MGNFAKGDAGSVVWPAGVPFPADAANGERRFYMECVGPWGIVRKLRGLACSKVPGGVVIHGDRNLTNPVEQGYCMAGRVSVDGKRYRAFTSSLLVEHDGKLWCLAILYVCDWTPQAPDVVVWVDEAEKSLAGSAGAVADSSGASQAVLGALLTAMAEG